MAEPREALAAILWNVKEGYSVADKESVGHGVLDWISPDDTHPDDVQERALILDHADFAIEQLRLAGWEFRPIT